MTFFAIKIRELFAQFPCALFPESATSTARRAPRGEAMSQDPANAGALAFKRSGDPNMGNFDDATILKSFGEVPKNLDEL